MKHIFTALLYLGLFTLTGPATAVNAEEVFEQYKDRLLQIRIIDSATNEKTTIGSGFYINKDGLVVTNYHVISKHVFNPEQYRIEIFDHNSNTYNASVLKVDVIHDLALLDSGQSNTPFLVLDKQSLQKGVRIFSLGNPLDLGMTIVEGNYNGLTDDTMHERILLSGSLNRGMSGGPTITDSGNIVGINVATAGNSISFLVPDNFLIDFLVDDEQTDGELISSIEQQLINNQDTFLKQLITSGLKTKQFGPFTVPATIADYLKCWGDSTDNIEAYSKSVTLCQTNNDIFVSSDISTGEIMYSHYVYERKDMNEYRFYNVIESEYNENISYATTFSGTPDHFTNFECHTDFVKQDTIDFKVAVCLRKYTDFKDLFDLAVYAVSVHDSDSVILTTLTVSGVSFDNAIDISKSYMEAFTWEPQ